MADQTEEKKHAPSGQKLQQLRKREGQVPRSKDFPSAVSLVITVAYVVIYFGEMKQKITSFFDIYDFIFKDTTYSPMLDIFVSAMKLSLSIVMPVFVIASISYIAASIFQTKGLIISFKSVAFKFEKLNPVEGIKKIFGLHGVSESIKILIKVTITTIILYLVLRWGLNALFWSPTCEESCVLQTSIYIIIVIIIALLILYFIVGVIDIWLSKILFSQDNKMTETEMKREIKDQMGSKELRQARNTLRKEAAKSPSIRGFGKATVVIHSGDALVALAYHPDKYDIPIVVAKKYGEEVNALVMEAKGKNIPFITNTQYLGNLMKYTQVGEPVPQSLIMETAQNFLDFGIIKR
jgi:type III secretion protein U